MIGTVMAAALAAGTAAAAPAVAVQPAPPPAPVTASLLAPALRVNDCAAAEAFYRAALAMRTVLSRDLGPIHETMLAFPGSTAAQPGIMLVCNVAPGSPPLRGLGASRLIVAVGDMDRIVARMDAAGLPHPAIHSPQDGIRVMTIADPAGNELELVQRAPRS